jgi:hypothetical protein
MTVFNEVVLYHTFETLEWATKYYWGGTLPPGAVPIIALALGESALCSENVVFSRFEVNNAVGVKIDEGDLGGFPGGQIDNMVDIHYALLLREQAPANKRPSVKYIHGFTVNAFTSLGELSSDYISAVGDFSSAMAASQWVDSDGGSVSGVLFRHFTRRKKMRQLSQ